MPARRLFAGASGYSFKEWRGTFYPDKLKPEEMLAFYSERLPTVEINNTFYRMPQAEMLRNWLAITPDDFRFAIKASRRITHIARLKGEAAADSVGYLYSKLVELGTKRGPVLFQLPPNLKKDMARLTDFLRSLPAGHQAALEFRNDTWFDDETYDALRSVGAALCVSEREDNLPPPLVATANWGYVRLRLEEYSDEELRGWATRLAATDWQAIHVFFMHEPTAPAYAQALMRHFG